MTPRPDTGRTAWLVAAYGLALALGYAGGARGALARLTSWDDEPVTPQARMGAALDAAALQNATAADWRQLTLDTQVVRDAWPDDATRPVLELVVALRGLETAGAPAWERAAQLCQSLRWRSCQRTTLQALAQAERP